MSQPVRIPADVDREDTVLANLTARQLLILAATGLVLYGVYTLTRGVIPAVAFLVVAIPIVVAAAVVALGRRDGLSLDRLVVAAIRQRLNPRHQVCAPEGIQSAPEWLTTKGPAAEVVPAALRFPPEGVSDTGVIDLGRDGLAAVAACGTVNFSLRTATEQESLVAAFGRYLHSLGAPIQVLIRAERLDLSGQIGELRERAGSLPHPALEAAAREHADYIAQLARSTDLLRRQVLIVLREPLQTSSARKGSRATSSLRRNRNRPSAQVADGPKRAGEARLARRLDEARDLLAPAGITVTALTASQVTAVLSSAFNPESRIPPSNDMAGADEVITTSSDHEWDATPFTSPVPDAVTTVDRWDDGDEIDDYDGRHGQ